MRQVCQGVRLKKAAYEKPARSIPAGFKKYRVIFVHLKKPGRPSSVEL